MLPLAVSSRCATATSAPVLLYGGCSASFCLVGYRQLAGGGRRCCGRAAWRGCTASRCGCGGCRRGSCWRSTCGSAPSCAGASTPTSTRCALTRIGQALIQKHRTALVHGVDWML